MYNIAYPAQDEIDQAAINDAVEDVSDGCRVNSRQALTTTPSTIVEADDAEHGTEPTANKKGRSIDTITPAPTSETQVRELVKQHAGQSDATQKAAHSRKSTRVLASQQDDSFNTQSSNIPEMKRTLQGMMLPEHFTQGDTQTQSLAYASAARSESTESPARSEISPWKPAATDIPRVISKPMLSQSVASKLEAEKTNLRQNALKLAKPGSVKSKKNADLVLCQCGYSEEEGDMVCSCFVPSSRVTADISLLGQLHVLRFVAAPSLLRLHW